MAIYPKNEKEYAGQSLNDKWTEVAKSENFKQAVASIAGEGGGGTLEILSTYPTTDASKAGQKFIYKGNEWKYHSQAELVDLGWDSAVSEGFPAPVSKNLYMQNIITNSDQNIATRVFITGLFSNATSLYPIGLSQGSNDIEINFLFFGDQVRKLRGTHIQLPTFTIQSRVTKIRNAELLFNLEDEGTAYALVLLKTTSTNLDISASVLNDFFTQLPPTTKTATISVINTTGAATCDPTIATAKGYTVITS